MVSQVGLLTALCTLGCLYLLFGIQGQVSGISAEPKLAKLL